MVECLVEYLAGCLVECWVEYLVECLVVIEAYMMDIILSPFQVVVIKEFK